MDGIAPQHTCAGGTTVSTAEDPEEHRSVMAVYPRTQRAKIGAKLLNVALRRAWPRRRRSAQDGLHLHLARDLGARCPRLRSPRPSAICRSMTRTATAVPSRQGVQLAAAFVGEEAQSRWRSECAMLTLWSKVDRARPGIVLLRLEGVEFVLPVGFLAS